MSSFLSNVLTTSIAASGTMSGSVKIGDNALVAIISTSALTATFQGSFDNVSFYNIYTGESTDPYEITCAASGLVTLDLNQFLAPAYVRVRSGTPDELIPIVATTLLLIAKEI